ncbi:hypothetical protein Hanom_Chr00s000188g01627761 [Helianthus anomalus]
MFWAKTKIFFFENTQSTFEKGSLSSQPENDENFHDAYLKTSEHSSNDHPVILMYKMCGSDQLYSDTECSIQNVNLNGIEKVFKLVEIKISEIESLTKESEISKIKRNNSYYSKPKNVYTNNQQRNYKGWNGFGYRYGKRNYNKLVKSKVLKKMTFVPASSENTNEIL